MADVSTINLESQRKNTNTAFDLRIVSAPLTPLFLSFVILHCLRIDNGSLTVSAVLLAANWTTFLLFDPTIFVCFRYIMLCSFDGTKGKNFTFCSVWYEAKKTKIVHRHHHRLSDKKKNCTCEHFLKINKTKMNRKFFSFLGIQKQTSFIIIFF